MEKKLNYITLKCKKTNFVSEKITDSQKAFKVIREFYNDDIELYESMFMLLLNRANMTIGFCKISQGGTVGTIIDNKIVAKYAIDSLASGVIIAHNHPSGNLNPSKSDIDITTKLNSALQLIDTSLLDHLIITNNDYYSLKDNGIF